MALTAQAIALAAMLAQLQNPTPAPDLRPSEQSVSRAHRARDAQIRDSQRRKHHHSKSTPRKKIGRIGQPFPGKSRRSR